MIAAKSKPTEKTGPMAFGAGAADAAQFGKSNIDAMVEATSIFLRGLEELSRIVFQLSQTQLDANIGAAGALAGIKSLGDLGEVQKAYTRAAFDNVVSEASQLSEIVIRVSSDAAEPLTARLQAVIDCLPKPPLAA